MEVTFKLARRDPSTSLRSAQDDGVIVNRADNASPARTEGSHEIILDTREVPRLRSG